MHFDDDEEAGEARPSRGTACRRSDARRPGANKRRHEADAFNCRHCGRAVLPQAYGSRHRNHCPHCLWSLHVDETVGDRRSACGANMEPIAVWVRADGEWALIHRCTACTTLRTNRIAADDNPWAMMSVAARALARPPFPLD